MRTKILVMMLPLLLVFGLAQAQDAEQAKQTMVEKTKAMQEKMDVDHLLGMMRLPEQARAARDAGIPEKEVRQVIEETRRRGLSAGETGEILQESGRAAKENGEIENFGAFVKERLEQGMRGRDLANAIHEEHRLRGKGKGNGAEQNRKQNQNNNQHKNQNQNQNMNKGEGRNQEREAEQEGQGKGHGGKKGGKSNGKNK